MNRIVTSSTILLCVLVLGGCLEGEPPTQEVDLSPDPSDPSGGRLDDPFTPEETRRLRDSFDWSATVALPETDPDGYPALRYAIAYASNDDERALLEAAGHYSPLPLFEVERRRWEGRTGRFGFTGDFEGMFYFIILPARTYNRFRELALEGRPPLRAVILREIPVPEARNEDGSLDYAWAAQWNFRLSNRSESSSGGSRMGLRREAIFDPVSGLVFLFSREVRQTVDDVFAELHRSGRAGVNFVHLVVGSTDPLHRSMVRAWGGGLDRDLVLGDVEVVAEFPFGSVVRRADENGRVYMPVAVGGSVTYCVRASNRYVQVDEGFDSIQICDFRGSGRTSIGAAVNGALVRVVVGDPVFNIVAQVTDGAKFAERVLGHRMRHVVRVLVGPVADWVGNLNGNRAFVSCGTYLRPRMGGELLGLFSGLLGPLPGGEILGLLAGGAGEVVLSHDVVFPASGTPGSGAWSRVIPTHEFGHVLTCDLMEEVGGARFVGREWGDVAITSLTQRQNSGAENLVLAEAIADFLTSQIVGATNYFAFDATEGVDGHGGFYCRFDTDGCVEDNVGSPRQRTTRRVLARDRDDDYARFVERVAQIVTLLTDVVDGRQSTDPARPLELPSDGKSWQRSEDGVLVLMPGDAGLADDEAVSVSGGFLVDTLRELYAAGERFEQRSFLRALAQVLRARVSEEAICELYALHAPGGMCAGLLPAEDLVSRPLVPAPPIIDRQALGGTFGHWSWRDVAPAATGFEYELVKTDATGRRTRVDGGLMAYMRRAQYNTRSIEPDTAYTFRVATQNGTVRSEFAERFAHSEAEGVGTVSAEPLPGAVRLSWAATRASSYRILDVTRDSRGREIGRTTDTQFVVTGLMGGVEKHYAVAAVNAVGDATAPSSPVRVTPLHPPTVYVATSGDDRHPEAGSARRPFRTLREAIARAEGTGATEVAVAHGAYEEDGPIVIRRGLTIRGGYDGVEGGWSSTTGRSQIAIRRSQTVRTCSTGAFNVDRLSTRAAVVIEPGADVTLENLEILAVPMDVTSGECLATVYASSGDLTVSNLELRADLESRAACAAQLVVHGGRTVTADRLTVTGIAGRSESSSNRLEVAGIAVCAADSVVVTGSTVQAAQFVTSGREFRARSMVGLAAVDVGQIRIDKSSVFALSGTLEMPASFRWALEGRLRGMELVARDEVSITNTIVSTPSGGVENFAVQIGSSTSELRRLQIHQVTSVAGADWQGQLTVTRGFRGASLALRGRMTDVAMYNNIFLYAAGGGSGYRMGPDVAYAGIDRQGVVGNPTTFDFRGNAVSVPYVNVFHAEALAHCEPGVEVSVRASDETDLNQWRNHMCQYDMMIRDWVVNGNVAFTRPARASGSGRQVLSLASSGSVDAGRESLRGVGLGLDRMPRALARELETDRNGAMRTPDRIRIGALASSY